MRARPIVRATVEVLLALPVIVLLARALLARAGVHLPVGTFIVSVAVPLVIAATVSAGAFVIEIGRRGIVLRESMKRFAAQRFTPGVIQQVTMAPDMLGVYDAFKGMQTELDHAIARLAHADAQRRRLFADLAHELATPASALLGLGDTLVQSDLTLDDAQRSRFLHLIQAETLRLALLVQDVRDLAELDDPDVSFNREIAPLGDVVSLAVQRISGLEGARMDLGIEPVDVAIDRLRIDQVITNVLSNARRYTPTDGVIDVSVCAETDRAIVTVDDSGPGVRADDRAHLGERLFRADASRDRRKGGHGLGLSIVTAIMARHAGSVSFAESPRGGLRVRLELPRAVTRSDPPPE